MGRNEYEQWELDLIIENHNKMGPTELWRTFLPHRSQGGVKAKIYQLVGSNGDKPKLWTEDEDLIVFNNYRQISKSKLQKLLPDRSWHSIVERASKLGVSAEQSEYWTDVEDNILYQYYQDMTTTQIQKEFLPNRTISGIKGRITKLNLGNKIESKEWSDLEIMMLCDLYPVSTDEELTQAFDRTITSITGCASRLGLKKEKWVRWRKGNYGKHKFDRHYFKQIDTPDKAYILGLLYADGWNVMSPPSFRVGIALKSEDGYLLDKIAEKIGYTNGTYYRENIDMTYLVVSKRQISEQLYRFGLFPRKSLILEYPYWLEDSLQSNFVRGYFDGDGSVTHHPEREGNRKARLSLSFASGSKDFLTGLHDTIKIHTGINKRKIYHQFNNSKIVENDKHGIYLIRWAAQAEVRTIFDWMYSDIFNYKSDLFLSRKYQKFYEFYNQ